MDPQSQPNSRARVSHEAENAQTQAKIPNERDRNLKRLYGRVPTRGNLLHRQLEGRKYFDSGDFALSQAHKASDVGAIKTGSEHPLRGEISHPLSRVPGSSNVDGDANRQQTGGEEKAGENVHASHLHEYSSQERSSDVGPENAQPGKESRGVGRQ